MSDITRAWKKDSRGLFLKMEVGENKPYGIDWTYFLAEISGDTVSASAWTIGPGLTKVADSIVGNITIVELSAPTAGEYACSHQMTTTQGVIEVTNFRVIVE